ncbi:diguanylate cyclase [Niveibacterium terrae]|uniref:GGDEF domain-containing protein n=1 Tax=Niveibacterium terrae TaxID=3373598 RepID=UPI003A910888
MAIRLGLCLILLSCAAQIAFAAPSLPSDVQVQVEAAISPRDISTGELLARIERIKLRLSDLPSPTRRRVLASEAEALIESASFDAARISIAELMSAAEAARDEADQIRAQVLRARIAYLRNDVPGQLEASRLAVALASSLKRPALSSLARQSLGLALFKQHHNEEAIGVLDLALREARAVKDPVLEASSYRAMALLNIGLYDNRRALQYIHEAQRLLRPQKQEWLLTSLLGIEAIVGGDAADGGESLPLLIQAYRKAQKLGLSVLEQYSLINLSDWFLIHKQWPLAIEHARRGLELQMPQVDAVAVGLLRLNMGQALFASGQSKEGVASLLKSAEILRPLEQQNYLLMALAQLAHSYEQLGQDREALAVMKEYRTVQETQMRLQRVAQVAELQEKFDSDRRQREISRLQLENRVAASEAEHHRLWSSFFATLAVLLIIAGGAGVAIFRRVRRANHDLAAANARLAFLAERDSLTGLFNRRAMHAWLETLPPASQDKPLGLALLDIDFFKSINDRFGHEVGDEVLVEVARRLGGLLREGDRLARWGGEEFLIALPGMAARGMEAFVERVLTRVGGENFRVGDASLRVTVSVGFCPFPAGDGAAVGSWDSYFTLIDQAMYHAKGKGRSGACGVFGFGAPWDEIRPVCIRDFSAAIHDGLIDVRHWQGVHADPAQVVAIGAHPPAA